MKQIGGVSQPLGGTPLKFNMEPENDPLEKEIPFGNPPFSGSMLNFGGVCLLPPFFFQMRPTQNSALYLLLMQWLHRNHGEASLGSRFFDGL